MEAARARAAYDLAHFAPGFFNMILVESDHPELDTMACDPFWRVYYNKTFVQKNTPEQNAAVLTHELDHLLGGHHERSIAKAVTNHEKWNIATDCANNESIEQMGLPLPGDYPTPKKFGLPPNSLPEVYYDLLPDSQQQGQKGKKGQAQGQQKGQGQGEPQQGMGKNCGSGAHGKPMPWEHPRDDGGDSSTPEVDATKAEMIRKEVAERIEAVCRQAGKMPAGWKRWAEGVLNPKVNWPAHIRTVTAKMIRDCTLGRYDRTYKRPNRRQSCYGSIIMPSFYQPRPRIGLVMDTSGSMSNKNLARGVTETASIFRQLGPGTEIIFACCDAAVHSVKKLYNAKNIELFGGGGTEMPAAIEKFEQMKEKVDLLIIVTDCYTAWPEKPPSFDTLVLRVENGAPPPWSGSKHHKVVTVLDDGGDE
jgi:predicted metal-dependent peptidase